jgi:hypothetical protein
LSKKQFEARYSEKDGNILKNHFHFDDNFIRVEINPDSEIPTDMKFETYMYQSIECIISETNAKIVIIDNLTYLKSGTETAKEALPLMKHLKAVKAKYNLSILALAHTPKRKKSEPISQNDLQGSKMLINFFFFFFAIGKSFVDENLRYIKQIKQRNCDLIYGTENVVVCEVVKSCNFLQFEFVGFGMEKEHLHFLSEKDKRELEANAKQLKAEGKSLRDIAAIVGVSKNTVDRLIKK